MSIYLVISTVLLLLLLLLLLATAAAVLEIVRSVPLFPINLIQRRCLRLAEDQDRGQILHPARCVACLTIDRAYKCDVL